jgi:pyridoxal phosphate enzyme (YggS family)
VGEGDRQGEREAELVANLGAVRSRIAAACEAAGRDQRAITLIAVTKTHPATDVAALARLGVRDIGENKDQEARAKLAELAELTGAAAPDTSTSLRWHLVGRLQTNKARSVVGYADAVHSVDRVKLATALADAAADQRDRPLDVFVQISLDGDPDRGGVRVAGVAEVAAAAAEHPQLRLRGVMAVAPLGADPDAAFAQLAEVSLALREDHPSADAISAGMSEDFEAAIRHGSTHVRVGSALLGRRSPVFG